jgi:hypothetical protein
MSRLLPNALTIAASLSLIVPLSADDPQTAREKAVALVKKFGGSVEVDEKAKAADGRNARYQDGHARRDHF